jgi:hypothetical protein
MADATADWNAALTTMSEAFIAGDNRRGEELLTFALDVGAPWDVATSAVAQALRSHRMLANLPHTATPAPA